MKTTLKYKIGDIIKWKQSHYSDLEHVGLVFDVKKSAEYPYGVYWITGATRGIPFDYYDVYCLKNYEAID